MSTVKISQLSELTTPAADDLLLITDSDASASKKIQKSNITQENFTTTLKNKLDGVESGATADQTAQEIATAIDADATAETTLKSALGLGTAAYTASTAYATAAQGSTADSALQPGDVDDTPVDGATQDPISSNWAYDHAALTTAHGISSFGATLVDDADAATARTTLGLGSAATTASTDYATAAQGSTADSALQDGDTVASLTITSADINGGTVDGITSLSVSGTSSLDGTVTINESGADVDFRIESDTNTHAFFLEGSSGNVGIKTSSPSMQLNISHGDQDGLRFNTTNTAESFIDFGDTDDDDIGRISYDHADDHMAFRTNNSERIHIDSSGNTTPGGDNTQDLGSSSKRWNELYVGGGIYLGGTGADNYLDDYEEGSASGTMSVFTATTRSWERYYRKIGNLVVEVFKCVLAGKTAGSGNFQIPTSFTPIGYPTTSTHQGGSIGINTINTSIAYFGLYGGNPAVYSNSINGNYISASSWNDGEISFTLIYFTA